MQEARIVTTSSGMSIGSLTSSSSRPAVSISGSGGSRFEDSDKLLRKQIDAARNLKNTIESGDESRIDAARQRLEKVEKERAQLSKFLEEASSPLELKSKTEAQSAKDLRSSAEADKYLESLTKDRRKLRESNTSRT